MIKTAPKPIRLGEHTQAQMLRWVDADAAKKDGGKVDELVVSLLGMSGKNSQGSWDFRNYATLHADQFYNSNINKQNVGSYSPLLANSNFGLTPAQIENRNDKAGAPAAKIGALVVGGMAAGPTLVAAGLEGVSFLANPLTYCRINPVGCLIATDVAVSTAAGVPQSLLPVASFGSVGGASIRTEQGLVNRGGTFELSVIGGGSGANRIELASGIEDINNVGFGQNVIRYVYHPEGKVIQQTLPDSCVAAACRMKISDAGIDVPEAYLRSDPGWVSGEGASFRNIPEALAIPENGGIMSIFSRDTMRLRELRDAIDANGPVIANVNGHAVVVDGISSGVVNIRDPLLGAYGVSVRDFLIGWKKNSRIVVTIKK